jgi:hypothetical protein
MSFETSIPKPPVLLGAAGLLPFFGLSLPLITGLEARFAWGSAVQGALAPYAAVIASFLGGIRWGFAVREPQGGALSDYVLSVAPSLLAWAARGLPRPTDLLALGALILAWGFVDQDLVRRGIAPPWFGRLRLFLSLGAGATLLAAGLSA